MPELTPDELGAYADLVRDEMDAWADASTRRTVAADPWPNDPDHVGDMDCGACGGWHAPGENCELDDILTAVNPDGTEGWAIWESYGSEAGPWQIQKVDCPEPHERVWETDSDVWDWLYFRLIHGDQLAGRVLVWVSNANPLERAAIVRNCVTGPR